MVEIPEELRLLQQTVRRFVQTELAPLEPGCLKTRALPPGTEERLQAKVKEMGLWAMEVPKEFGGAGLRGLGVALVHEELAQVLVPTRRPWGGGIFGGTPPAPLYACNEAQKERYLYPTVAAERIGCFAMTEPNAGSDPGGMIETFAARDGSDWVINGTKTYISNADIADYAVLFARTDPDRSKKARGISCFLVDKGTKGFTVGRPIPNMGTHHIFELVFEDCRVPADALVGQPGQGFALGQRWLTNVRGSMGASCAGQAQRCVNDTIRWVRQRHTFGQPLAERQAVQFMLADSMVGIHSVRLMAYDLASKAERGEDVRMEASIVKISASEMLDRVLDRTIQIFGGLGYSSDLPYELMYRNARVQRIFDGANEIQRWVIARMMLRD